jgi:outer membrane receptor protein involved in Fe transport
MCCSGNIGYATTSGIELEAKFRLNQLIAAAPRVEMRSNLSLHTSRVKSVPGPDNRLDQQAKATGNIGADYRLRGLPFTLGGNLNWVPGYTTRPDVDQTTSVSTLCTSCGANIVSLPRPAATCGAWNTSSIGPPSSSKGVSSQCRQGVSF